LIIKLILLLFHGIIKRIKSNGILRKTKIRQKIQNSKEKKPSHLQVSPVSFLIIKSIAIIRKRKKDPMVWYNNGHLRDS